MSSKCPTYRSNGWESVTLVDILDRPQSINDPDCNSMSCSLAIVAFERSALRQKYRFLDETGDKRSRLHIGDVETTFFVLEHPVKARSKANARWHNSYMIITSEVV
jgi:hypothetical protein